MLKNFVDHNFETLNWHLNISSSKVFEKINSSFTRNYASISTPKCQNPFFQFLQLVYNFWNFLWLRKFKIPKMQHAILKRDSQYFASKTPKMTMMGRKWKKNQVQRFLCKVLTFWEDSIVGKMETFNSDQMRYLVGFLKVNCCLTLEKSLKKTPKESKTNWRCFTN